MSTPLSILSFVKAWRVVKMRRTLKPRCVYGYVADLVDDLTSPASVAICHHNGINPVIDLFDLSQISIISEDEFYLKTKGQTALHSQYHDAKERHVHDPRTAPSLSSNAGAALKAADALAALADRLSCAGYGGNLVSKVKLAARSYKAARLKHVAEG